MRTRTIIAAATTALAVALTGCSLEARPESDAKASPSKADGISAEDMAKAREAAGLPPEPTAAQAAALVRDLNAIDPDIVHGKTEKALSRATNTCGTFKSFPGDRAKQIKQTTIRWSSPTHPEGRTLPVAEKILDAVHKNLCPKF
ncbi:hypothetical protein [Streptomyces sp. NPDC003688]